jgi:hypothetical protein
VSSLLHAGGKTLLVYDDADNPDSYSMLELEDEAALNKLLAQGHRLFRLCEGRRIMVTRFDQVDNMCSCTWDPVTVERVGGWCWAGMASVLAQTGRRCWRHKCIVV